MARKSRVNIVGKRAPFGVERSPRAVEALARQRHSERPESGKAPPPDDATAISEDKDR